MDRCYRYFVRARGGLGLVASACGQATVGRIPSERWYRGLETVDPNDENPRIYLPTALTGIPSDCLCASAFASACWLAWPDCVATFMRSDTRARARGQQRPKTLF